MEMASNAGVLLNVGDESFASSFRKAIGNSFADNHQPVKGMLTIR